MKGASPHYAIYTRQSSSDAGKVLSSCEAQFSICQDFVKSRAAPRCKWIGERFDDAGVSGATRERPAFERLMELVRAGKVGKVVVYRLDRLSRSLRDCLDILQTFREAGVELLIVTSPESGSIATDNFLLNLMASFAEFERELIRSRLDDTRQALKRRGRRLAGRVPFGYEADPKTKQLVVNHDEARRVEAMFQMAADGALPRDIAETANGLGWRTKVTVARRSGRRTGGGPWIPRQVLQLLSNPVYLGEFAEGDGTRHGCHQAIVARDLFETARERIESRRTTRRRIPAVRGSRWPLRGKILCSRCDRIMSTHLSCRGPIRYRHYRCRSHAGGRPPCRGSALPAGEIETLVDRMLLEPGLLKGQKRLSQARRRLVREFQVVWSAMELLARDRALPEVIKQVVFQEDESKLSVVLDLEGLERISEKGKELLKSPL